MDTSSGQDYAGLNNNFLLMTENDKNGLMIKTLYSYGKKKHLVDTIDNRKSGKRRWFIIKNINSADEDERSIQELIPTSIKTHEDNKEVLRKVTFENKRSLYLPSPDPDYGKAPEVPKYGKKVLGIEFSFEVRGQIVKYLNQII